jgi:glycosyltransferase involved in cell wall biosynthesis
MSARVCAQSRDQGAKPEVLLVADNGGAGGIERYCVDVAHALHPSAAVICLCSEPCDGEEPCWIARQCRMRGLRLVAVHMPAKAWLQGFKAFAEVWKNEGRPIVHVNGRRGNFLATLGKATFSDFHFATTVHGVLGLHARRNSVYRLVDLAASRAADVVIAVSVDTARRLNAARVPARKTMVISNGLAPEFLSAVTAASGVRSQARANAGLRVGFVGRLSVEKGILDFAELAQRLSGEGIDATFCVAGDGPCKNEFLDRCASLVRSGSLTYLGEVADPGAALANLEILVMPSHNEGLPFVLLEAMAYGCAVVAYGVGGIPEVVIDRSVGLLVRPGDSEGLYSTVASLLRDKPQARLVGANASSYVADRFLLSGRVSRLLEAYRRCSPEHATRIAARLTPSGQGPEENQD